jgi:hypothetical protein
MPFPAHVLHLYQIGDIQTNAFTVGFPSRAVSPIGSNVQLQDSYRTLVSTSEIISKPRSETWRVKLWDTYFTAGQTLQRLYRHIGKITSFLAYEISNPLKAVPNDCCYRCCCGKCSYNWYETTGRIESITLVNNNSADDYEIDITISFSDYWRGMNKYMWQWGSDSLQSLQCEEFDVLNHRKYCSIFPSCSNLDCKDCKHFKKNYFTNYNWMLNLDVVCGLMNCAEGDDFEIGKTQGWSTGAESYFNIRVNEYRWSAPPQSIYLYRFVRKEFVIDYSEKDGSGAIQNVVPSGKSYLDIKQASSLTLRELTHEIDWDVLDSLYTDKGLTPQTTDILILGDIDGHARVINSETLATRLYAASAIKTGGGAWWGQLLPTQNILNFRNNTNKIHQAAIHWFRRL